MKRRTTYRLLVQSEEKSRNLLEMAIYGLITVSVMATIWQFAEQPLQATAKTAPQGVAEVQVAS